MTDHWYKNLEDPNTNHMRVRGVEVATAWVNSDGRVTWHTWDEDGVGGENGVEDDIDTAKTAALVAAFRQGFVVLMTP